jgi:chromosome segregation ATPase
MNEELTGLRDEMRQGFAEMRQEMRQGFARVDERLGALGQDMSELRQDVVGLRQGLASLTRRVDVLEDRVRANGVLLEAIRDDVRQIAEAHVLLVQRVAEYRSESDAQRAILSLLQTSYRDLDRRLTRLEERAGDTGPGARSR